MRYRVVLLFLLLFVSMGINAQELNATVEINSTKIEGTNKSVFDDLKKTLTDFINSRKWTEYEFKNQEKIKCAFTIIVNKYDKNTGRFECECYVQSSRPVYNASYTTTTWQQKDSKFNFEYHEFDKLNYDDEHVENNLTAMIAYYCYLIIGIDLDTMAPKGGTDLLHKAMSLTTNAQALGDAGWKAFAEVGNRFGIINDLVNEAYAPFRQCLYDYHRKGLDQMAENPEEGRKAITEALKLLGEAYQNRSISAIPNLFTEFKRDEIVGIYKGQGTSQDKQSIYDILIKINASQNNFWKEMRE